MFFFSVCFLIALFFFGKKLENFLEKKMENFTWPDRVGGVRAARSKSQSRPLRIARPPPSPPPSVFTIQPHFKRCARKSVYHC